MVNIPETRLIAAGSTYCCLAAVSMFGALPVEADDTIRWLAHRQISSGKGKGGFNGRVNKPADTCYSFWVGGALDVCPQGHC